jgi:type IV pilus assembly protein PilW
VALHAQSTPFAILFMYNLKVLACAESNERVVKRPRRFSGKHRQIGLSLVELMVGITIGLLVVLAAIGSLVATQVTSAVTGDSARLQQKADAVFRNLAFHLTQAGAIVLAPPSVAQPAVLVFNEGYTGFNPVTTGAPVGQIFSIHGVNGAANAPDTLRISYQDNGTVRDCLGNQQPPTANVRVDNTFSINLTDLMCQGGEGAVPAVQPQSIADRVEDFQVTYGVQTFVAGAAQYRFYRADEMLAFPLTPNWTSIQAVSICLQLTGDTLGNPQPGLVMIGCRGQDIASDGALRRVYQRTFALRNSML